ncbi:hypothetical protein NPIL_492591 [Nephila pilipes]|uniref:Uncharacterized protein n=1 Tax=Nephila pilipes TaxID=299642 RepID=A0A8X6U2E6_NEPPI|nr:hypothetical protein NPIL_492591 [Nephila pilipes]
MSYLMSALKEDLQSMAMEMGIKDVNAMTKFHLQNAIINSKDYAEEKNERKCSKVLRKRGKEKRREGAERTNQGRGFNGVLIRTLGVIKFLTRVLQWIPTGVSRIDHGVRRHLTFVTYSTVMLSPNNLLPLPY